jgi:hypothetical protein
VLCAGGNGTCVGQTLSLESLDHGRAHIAREQDTIRPQRGSLEISTIGAKVQFTPDRAASKAATLAPSRASEGFQVAAWPSGIGNIVLKP